MRTHSEDVKKEYRALEWEVFDDFVQMFSGGQIVFNEVWDFLF